MTDLTAKFIVLDGTEGCGKSTQAQLLYKRLEREGVDSILARDPGSTHIGEEVRAMLLDARNTEMAMRCEMLLYMAARAQMMSKIILPALAAEKTVVCDRFVSSTLAYQLGGEGLTAQDIKATAEVAIHGRWPDLTLILDMPPGDSLARVNRAKDRIEQRPMTYHEQVRRNYRMQAEQDPVQYRVISAAGTQDEVHERIWEAVTRAMDIEY